MDNVEVDVDVDEELKQLQEEYLDDEQSQESDVEDTVDTVAVGLADSVEGPNVETYKKQLKTEVKALRLQLVLCAKDPPSRASSLRRNQFRNLSHQRHPFMVRRLRSKRMTLRTMKNSQA